MTVNADNNADEETLLIMDRAHEDEAMDEDEGSEEDGEYDPDADDDEDMEAEEDGEEQGETQSERSDTHSSPSESMTPNGSKRERRVSFNKVVEVESHEQQTLTGSSGDETESEEDSDSDLSSSDISSSDTSSDTSSDLSSTDSDEIEELPPLKKRKVAENGTVKGVSKTPSELATPVTRFKSQSEGVDSKKTTIATTPPGQGKKTTQIRNVRRRNKNQLRSLVEEGKLPLGSTTKDLENWRHAQSQGFEDQGKTDEEAKIKFEEQREALLESLKDGGIDVTEFRRSEAAVVTTPRTSSKEAELGQPKTKRKDDISPDAPSEMPQKRARLDIAGSRRLLFGSLGLRTPKTKEDEDRLRERLAASSNSKKSASSTSLNGPPSAGPQNEQDGADIAPTSDTWQNKIRLSAVECVDQGVRLSQPPFPFQQCWDPQYAWNRPNKNRRKKKRKARSSYGNNINSQAEEGGDESLVTEDGDVSYLEYDEPVEADVNGTSASVQDEVDTEGFPAIPKNPSSLPILDRKECKEGVFVAFKQLEVSAATNWAPEISAWRCARIEHVDGIDAAYLQIKLSPRDRSKSASGTLVSRDRNGRRLSEKFEMPAHSSDEEEEEVDDGLREVAFEELLDAKLVRPGSDKPTDKPVGILKKTPQPPDASSDAVNGHIAVLGSFAADVKKLQKVAAEIDGNVVKARNEHDSDIEWSGIGEEREDESASSSDAEGNVVKRPGILKVKAEPGMTDLGVPAKAPLNGTST